MLTTSKIMSFRPLFFLGLVVSLMNYQTLKNLHYDQSFPALPLKLDVKIISENHPAGLPPNTSLNSNAPSPPTPPPPTGPHITLTSTSSGYNYNIQNFSPHSIDLMKILKEGDFRIIGNESMGIEGFDGEVLTELEGGEKEKGEM
ncbi:hypothetical protein TL16_g07438 [Triparma laevis f. inornata]|uniref:Uncharacterized protein n=2 Tax=Triparma laevis TaxID=1534972 RepID=A0A9W7KYU0_9STRA|nr:hypothetical protein TL16_g07438 [Triparma laevis f. inornata]GMI16399.1 hypothetical protein TrLO_g12291 [Triparma laevis f. longispina]